MFKSSHKVFEFCFREPNGSRQGHFAPMLNRQEHLGQYGGSSLRMPLKPLGLPQQLC
jgi:hypothetical protein